MDLTKHKQIQHDCLSKADYFQRIDFPNIAESFQKAAEVLEELIAVVEKINEPTPEKAQGDNHE